MDWAAHYAGRVARFQGSAVREMFQWASLPGVISLSAGSPAPETFPVEAFRQAADQALADDPAGSLQYSITEGYLPLREWICEYLAAKGLTVGPDEVLVTTGSQQAMDLLVRVLVDKGDVAAVERPTFIATLQALDTCEADFLSVPMDGDGMVVEALASAIGSGQRPKLVSVQPNFQNPTGVSLSLERRRALAALVMDAGLPLIEDDPYAELTYEGQPLPPIASMAPRQTLYLGSFSKILAPGIRVGWVAGPQAVLEKMAVVKQSNDLHTDILMQRIVNTIVRSGMLPAHIDRIRHIYRERLQVMLDSLQRFFPSAARWTRPRGGLFVWVELPDGLDCGTFVRAAVDRGVLFPPGAGFFRDGSGQNTMRLNFSNAQPERIRAGVERLGAVIAEQVAAG